MNPKILCFLVSIFTIVWATNLPKTPQEKDSGGPSRNQPKFNHSKQSAFHKVVPKSSNQSDKTKTNEVEADQSKQSDQLKTNEVEADQSKQNDKIKTDEVEADQSKQSDQLKTNEVEADQSKQKDKIEANEVEADQSKQNDKIEANEVEADQSKQSDKIETNKVEADQNQTDRTELLAEKSFRAQTPSNESLKRQSDKSGDESNQSSEATLSVGENENEPGKRRRLANKQQIRQMDESIDGEGDEKMDAEMVGDAGPSDRRRKAVASTDKSINSEPPKNTENSSTPSMSHHQLESQIRQQSQQLIQLDQKMEKILRMLPVQQQRSQEQQHNHQQAQQEQQVHELPTAQQTVATQKPMAQAAEQQQQQHHLIQQSQQPVASFQQQPYQVQSRNHQLQQVMREQIKTAEEQQHYQQPQQLPPPQSLQQQNSTWLQRYNRMLGGQSLQSSADAQQQSQVQNQYQQQARRMNFLAQLQQHNQLQPSQSQIHPTQLQSGLISTQRQKQSPWPMTQHQLHSLLFRTTPRPQLHGSSSSVPQLHGSSSSMPQLHGSSSSMPQLHGSSSSMPQLHGSSSSMPQLHGSSSSMPQLHGSSSSMPQLHGSSASMPQLHGSSSSVSQLHGSSSSMPQLHGSSSSMPQLHGSSSSMPQLHGSSSSMPQLHGSSSSMPQLHGSSSSMPQLHGSSSSMPQLHGSSSSVPQLHGSSSSVPQLHGSSSSMPQLHGSSSSMPQLHGSSASMPQLHGSSSSVSQLHGSSSSMPQLHGSSSSMPQLHGSSSSMPQLHGSSSSMPQLHGSSSSMPQLHGSSSSMPQLHGSSSSMPQLHGSSSSMPQLHGSSSSVPQLHGSSSSMPQLHGSSSSVPQLHGSSSSMPQLHGSSSSVSQLHGSSSSMPQLHGSSSSMPLPLPQQQASSSSMPLPLPQQRASSLLMPQQQIHQLHHSQTFLELVKQKQQKIIQLKKDPPTRWPISPVVGGILESSANNSIQQPVDKGKQHLAKVGAVGQLPTPTSASSFDLPGISDQLLPVNLAVNEAGTSQNSEQPAVSLRKQYVEVIVKKAAMKSISIIQLSLKNYGFDGPPELFGGLYPRNAEHASKMATAIDVVKAAETNTAQFVIDQMKTDSPQITQILEEIGEESADFERHMKARTANWEAAKNQQMFRENNFLLAFGRFYCKLFILLTTAFGPNALQQKSDVKNLLVWTDTMRKEIFKKLKNSEAQNPEALKWCESLFQLELTNDLAKLAIEIAFPPNSLNAWISSGRSWSVLNEMLNQIKLDEFLAHFDDISWNKSNYMDLIRKLTGYAAENNTMFNSFAVCKLTALIDTIVTRTHSLIPRQDMREAANLNNLVLISALFHKLIADFETANNDVIRLAKLREESKSAQNILKLCLSVLDAKFNEFKKHALDTISAMDVIRKGITEDDEGANAQSK